MLADLAISRPAGFTVEIPLPLSNASDRLLSVKGWKQNNGNLLIPVTLELLGTTEMPSIVERGGSSSKPKVTTGKAVALYATTSVPGSYTAEDGPVHAKALVGEDGAFHLMVLAEDTRLSVTGTPPPPPPPGRTRRLPAPLLGTYRLESTVSTSEAGSIIVYLPPDAPVPAAGENRCTDGYDNDIDQTAHS